MTVANVSPALHEVLSVTRIPALPQSAIRLLQLSQSDDAGPPEFARVIESDPGLMGQVLRFVNSAYFGFSREIGSIQQAITLVGIRSITNFSLWSAVFGLIPNPRVGDFNLNALWQDSLRRAIFARLLGRALKVPDADDLFAGALLQDMAIPLLLEQAAESYVPIIERRANEQRRLSIVEREAFGWDHAEAAALVARNWNLPERFVEVIEMHTQLQPLLEAGRPAHRQACVAVASLLPSATDEEWEERIEFIYAFEALSEGAADLKEILSQTDSEAEDFSPLLRLPAPQRTLLSWIESVDQEDE